jgi:hypothetical protein
VPNPSVTAARLGLVATDHTQVRAEGWNHYIERQIAPRWPAVCRSWFPENSEYSVDWTWRSFEYVFPLEDPRGTAPLVHPEYSEAEEAAINRYLAQARDLAGATVLTARNGFRVNMATADSEPEITETVSARDATIGFLTMLRQFDSPDELASFERAYDLLSREMHREGRDLQPLKEWRKAHAKLRNSHLDHLILVQAAADAHVPKHLAERNAFHPDSVDSPELMIAAIFYGDAIHWGDRRSVIEDWSNETAVVAVKRKFDVLRCAVHVGHLYVGFAGVVGLATGRLSLGDV